MRAVLATVLCSLIPHLTYALPSVTFTGNYENNSGNIVLINGPGTYSGSGCNPSIVDPLLACWNDSLALSYTNGKAEITVTGSNLVTTPPRGRNGASGSIDFWFEVTGPNVVAVPVMFTFSGSTSISGLSVDVVVADVLAASNAGLFPTLSACSAENSPCNSPSSFGGTVSGTVLSNTPYDISVVAEGVISGRGGNVPTSFQATIDPSVVIDPTFALPGYSIIFSPDFTVPEPSTSLLLMTGIVALGVGRWGRRRTSAD